jgi:SAM-dependent methyltransferase/aminoglycoside phosphotransferase (APT) family kinase protein
MNAFACPACLDGSLAESVDAVSCVSCGSRYARHGRVVDFANAEHAFSWGLDSSEMEQMLADVQHTGWHDGMMRLLDRLPAPHAQLIWTRTLGVRRPMLQMLLPAGARSRVLDLGCGWGSIALALAESCGEVVAFDQSMLHLRWLEAAASGLQRDNIRLAHGGDTPRLPFASGSFDAVVLNGVFEWVAGNRAGKPETIQREFLREVGRILAPGGHVYVGIENRLSYKYFLGVPEGHINMRFGAVLPRAATRLYLKWRRGEDFRVRTYSVWGYKRLFAAAGFGAPRVYVTWPNYSSATQVFEGPSSTPAPWRIEPRHPGGRWPGRVFAPAFAMTATAGAPSAPIIDAILLRLHKDKGLPLPLRLKDRLFKVTSSGKAVARVSAGAGADWMVHIGLTPRAGSWIRAQHEAVSALHDSRLPTAVDSAIPVSLMLGEEQGFVFGVEPFVRGDDGGNAIHDDTRRTRLCAAALEFIAGLHRARAVATPLDEASLERLVTVPMSALRQWFTDDEWTVQGGWFAEMEQWLRHALTGRQLALVPRHGDFVPENCLQSNSDGALTVLDWELYEENGLPLLDWITFLGCAFRPEVRREMQARGEDPAATRFHGYPGIFIEPRLRALLDEYMTRMQLDPELLNPLLFLWWVKQLQDWAPLHLYNPEWRRLRVFPVIERWQALLSQR